MILSETRGRWLTKIFLIIGCIVSILWIENYKKNLLKNPTQTLEKSTLRTPEVFGFAPYWTINNLNHTDFSTLTTLAYFDLPIQANGEIDRNHQGYKTLKSSKATTLFQNAQKEGNDVVLTITQMDNRTIDAFLDNGDAQQRAIHETLSEVKSMGLNGVNIDFEYIGNPGEDKRKKFTAFAKNLSDKAHEENPNANVTVSVYASSAKDPKIYDIGKLSNSTDGIFMMAYDFATKSAQQAMPTSPLYGHKEGKYWYDIATAVEDFLKVMPAEKLIVGLPWYGYDYPVYEPQASAQVHQGFVRKVKRYRSNRWSWYWQTIRTKPPSFVQTAKKVQDDIVSNSNNINVQSGWDDVGKVGWIAYKSSGVWRMVFIEDNRSLAYKYDFIKDKGLGGVGIWALGYEDSRESFWSLLKEKFGDKLATSS